MTSRTYFCIQIASLFMLSAANSETVLVASFCVLMAMLHLLMAAFPWLCPFEEPAK